MLPRMSFETFGTSVPNMSASIIGKKGTQLLKSDYILNLYLVDVRTEHHYKLTDQMSK